MKEIWKDIKNYEGLYQISNLGNVKSIERVIKRKNNVLLKIPECTIKKWIANNGYYTVSLWRNGKGKFVTIHKLIAEAFIPNPNNYLCINHIDGNKLNNEINNLEFCTYSHNNKEAYRIGLKKGYWINKTGKNHCSSIKINQYNLNGELIKKWDCITDVERKLNFFRTNICKCLKGKTKSAYGYKWKYANNR